MHDLVGQKAINYCTIPVDSHFLSSNLHLLFSRDNNPLGILGAAPKALNRLLIN